MSISDTDMTEQVKLSNEIVEEILAEERAEVTRARAEGRGEAIALATRAMCSRCDDPSRWRPAAWTTYGWEHETLDPTWLPEAPYLCHAAPIWEAIKAEGRP